MLQTLDSFKGSLTGSSIQRARSNKNKNCAARVLQLDQVWLRQRFLVYSMSGALYSREQNALVRRAATLTLYWESTGQKVHAEVNERALRDQENPEKALLQD